MCDKLDKRHGSWVFFLMPEKDDGYIVRREKNDHANENTGGGSCAR